MEIFRVQIHSTPFNYHIILKKKMVEPTRVRQLSKLTLAKFWIVYTQIIGLCGSEFVFDPDYDQIWYKSITIFNERFSN